MQDMLGVFHSSLSHGSQINIFIYGQIVVSVYSFLSEMKFIMFNVQDTQIEDSLIQFNYFS